MVCVVVQDGQHNVKALGSEKNLACCNRHRPLCVDENDRVSKPAVELVRRFIGERLTRLALRDTETSEVELHSAFDEFDQQILVVVSQHGQALQREKTFAGSSTVTAPVFASSLPQGYDYRSPRSRRP